MYVLKYLMNYKKFRKIFPCLAVCTKDNVGHTGFHWSCSEGHYKVVKLILENSDFGKSGHGKGKTANVEFVSANPTGPLTVGHGRNAVLGDAVSNILEWNGFSVTREYYFNDAGRQMRVLSESVEARYFETLNKPSEFPEDGYQGSYINDIAKEMLSLIHI